MLIWLFGELGRLCHLTDLIISIQKQADYKNEADDYRYLPRIVGEGFVDGRSVLAHDAPC